MRRKKFINKLVFGAGGLVLFPSVFGRSTSHGAERVSSEPPMFSEGKVRFGVITDVHQDFFPEAETRLEAFIRAAKEAQVDFIIQLGDFVYPKANNANFMRIWNDFPGAKYHVLGNHDMDAASKITFLDFVGQTDKGAHYSFDQGGFHFVVLDSNFIKQGNTYIPYEHKNYREFSSEEIAHISAEQLDWLQNDLSGTSKPTLLFSHQPLNGSVANSAAVQTIIKDANAQGKKVVAAFSGHLHKNWHLLIDSVHHIQMNSASYFYVGKRHPLVHGRYPEDVEKAYPLLPEFAPYDRSLFAIVELDGPRRTLSIEGRDAEFMPPTPYELEYYAREGQMSPSSKIDSRTLHF